jgi:DNA-binding XRE family transcriptional regulator
LRILFAFDPRRTAILLIGGDKSGRWNQWYAAMVPLADQLYDQPRRLSPRGSVAVTKTKSFDILRRKVRADPERARRVAEHKRAIMDALALAEAREQRNVTQKDIAEILGVTQANVSRIEREEDVYLSTLRKYVEALGGRLEVSAVFPDKTVSLSRSNRSRR